MSSRRGLWWLLVVCVLAGVALRAVEADGKSLWLDEYHSLYLADSDDMAEVVDKVAHDFRPPLFFWGMSFLRGVDAHLQRWIPILFSLLALVPLWSILQHGGVSRLASTAACGVLLFAPYQVQYGVDLRSYSAVQLVTLVLVWAAVTSAGPAAARFAVFAVATAVGLYIHYGVAVAVVGVGFARCLVRPSGSLGLSRVVIAGTLGVLMFLPWVLSVEGWLFSDPEQILPPSSRAGAETAAEAPTSPSDLGLKAALVIPRTLIPAMDSLGAAASAHLRAAGWILLGLGLLGSLNLLRRPRDGVDRARVVTAALLVSGAGFVITTALCVSLWHRVPMQYFVVASWGWPLLVGLMLDAVPGRGRRVSAGLVIAAFLFAGIGQLRGESREDTERGVEVALQEGANRDAIYTAVLWQPAWYPHTLPWRFLDAEPRTGPVEVLEPTDVPPGDRSDRPVVVVTRKARPRGEHVLAGVWDSIERGRRLVKAVAVDPATRVYVYEPR